MPSLPFRHDLDAVFVVRTRSPTAVDRRMAVLAKDVAGVLLPEEG